MCYPRETIIDQIGTIIPQDIEQVEDTDELNLMLGENYENITSPLFTFHTFICDVIHWLEGMKPSKDEMSISRVLVKMMFDFRHVINNKLIEVKLKSIYGKVVINERRYEGTIKHYIEVFKEIRGVMDQYLIDADNCVGDLERMITLMNRFHRYSEGIIENDFQNLHKNVLNLNKLHQKTQMTLYSKFVHNLWCVRPQLKT